MPNGAMNRRHGLGFHLGRCPVCVWLGSGHVPAMPQRNRETAYIQTLSRQGIKQLGEVALNELFACQVGCAHLSRYHPVIEDYLYVHITYSFDGEANLERSVTTFEDGKIRRDPGHVVQWFCSRVRRGSVIGS
jgi:hypothetical protein